MFDVFEGKGERGIQYSRWTPWRWGERERIRKWLAGRLAGERMHYLSTRFSFPTRNLWFSFGHESMARNCFILIAKRIIYSYKTSLQTVKPH